MKLEKIFFCCKEPAKFNFHLFVLKRKLKKALKRYKHRLRLTHITLKTAYSFLKVNCVTVEDRTEGQSISCIHITYLYEVNLALSCILYSAKHMHC